MRSIDKLLLKAKKIKRKSIPSVHIIEGGYCYSCKGECLYANMDDIELMELEGSNIIIISGDLPDERNGYEDAPSDTLKTILHVLGDDEYIE
ncbi:MAG: hypothetical protein E6370_11215 [Clostridiales bacterium]|nr:hypothetical protein [Clostridiales bacterium]MDU6974881.1 hypothetical protein [Clostridiales bacterium]